MNSIINQFKSDFFNGVLTLVKKSWTKILFAYLMYYFSMLILGGIFALIAIVGSVDTAFFTEMLSNPSPSQADSLFFVEQIASMIQTPEFIISFLVLFIILLIAASWNYYFAFLAGDAIVKGENKSFGQLLKQSFSVEVFKLVLVILVLNIIMVLLFFVAAISANLSGILAFLLFLFAFVVSMRFILVLPAYTIGNYDFSSAFSFSFYHINWSRAFKFFGICILAFLVLLGVSLIIGLISGVFSFIPFIGPLIQMAINVFLGAIMMAVTVGALVGLYYRYAGQENQPDTTEVKPEA